MRHAQTAVESTPEMYAVFSSNFKEAVDTAAAVLVDSVKGVEFEIVFEHRRFRLKVRKASFHDAYSALKSRGIGASIGA